MIAQEIEKKSTHKCEVVPLMLEKHPNADKLSIAQVFGFTCVTNTEQWAGKDRAVYVPPDSLVPTSRPEFSFLLPKARADGFYRIRAIKLRGSLSFGLLVAAPEGVQIGDDVADILGVTHYEPPLRGSGPRSAMFSSGEAASAPNVYHVKYDLDSGRRYAKEVFVNGEQVIISEKIHGSNGRFCFLDGKMHCGSRTEWKKEYPDYSHVTAEKLVPQLEKNMSTDEAVRRAAEIINKLRLQSENKIKNMWWMALEATPSLRVLCENNPGVVVYGEVYGCQGLRYGLEAGKVAFAAFDIMVDGKWLDYHEARALADKYGVPWVPVLAEQGYNFDQICNMAEGKTTINGANHVREGVVVRPVKERYDHSVGRVCLKWVGAGYLEKDVEVVAEENDDVSVGSVS